jgi:hypothetical protein
VDAQGRPKGDFDLDCDVDQSDFAVFQANMTGAITPCTPATEICDGLDNNCNCLIDDGANASCPNVPHGTGLCQAGSCTFTCNAGYANCNGNPGDGCEVNLAAGACAASTLLGTVRGDTGSDVVSADASGTRWYRVAVSEALLATTVQLSARIRLTHPAGTGYNVYVYCGNCGSGAAWVSTGGGPTTETVFYAKSDFASDDGQNLVIEVRYISGEDCGNYNLEVTGNPGGLGQFTCP